MENVVVHPRIHRRHPDVSDQDVRDAWAGCIRSVPRLGADGDEYVAVGCDAKGRLLEMVARRIDADTWLVFHVMTPPTRKTLVELGMTRRS